MVRSWRIVGSGGGGFFFGINGLIQKPTRNRRASLKENHDSANKLNNLAFMDRN
jgi:hypothetical protein